MFRVKDKYATSVLVLTFVASIVGLLSNAWFVILVAVGLYVVAFRSYDPAFDREPPDQKWIRIRD